MPQFIDNIRQQSYQHKNRVIWITIGIAAMILIIIWVIVGIPKREGSTTDVIDQFNNNVNDSKDDLPKLFDNNK
jgi:uncharacterized membrane protein YvbJ